MSSELAGDLVKASEVSKNDAEAELNWAKAERERTLHEANKIGLEFDRQRLMWAQASDLDNRIYRFDEPVTNKSCGLCYEWLSRCARIDIEQPVEIQLTTLGGSVFHGMALVDQILALREQGLTVRITARGTVASMGVILLQAASEGERVGGRGCTYVIHKLSWEAEGSLDQMQDMIDWAKIMQAQSDELLLSRSNLTKTQLVRGMSRKDWSFGSAEAQGLGIIDRIG